MRHRRRKHEKGLGVSIQKYRGSYIPTCDICGAELPEQSSKLEAAKAIKEAERKAGFNRFGEHEDFCPDCQEET